MTKRLFWLAIGIELFGLILISFGLGYSVAYGVDTAHALITGGSAITAAGGILFGKFIKGTRLW